MQISKQPAKKISIKNKPITKKMKALKVAKLSSGESRQERKALKKELKIKLNLLIIRLKILINEQQKKQKMF